MSRWERFTDDEIEAISGSFEIAHQVADMLAESQGVPRETHTDSAHAIRKLQEQLAQEREMRGIGQG